MIIYACHRLIFTPAALKDPDGSLLANDVTEDMALQWLSCKNQKHFAFCTLYKPMVFLLHAPWLHLGTRTESLPRSGTSGRTEVDHGNASQCSAATGKSKDNFPVLQHNQDVYSSSLNLQC